MEIPQVAKDLTRRPVTGPPEYFSEGLSEKRAGFPDLPGHRGNLLFPESFRRWFAADQSLRGCESLQTKFELHPA